MRPQVRVLALPLSGRPYDHWGFGLTRARSAARPLAPPYLRPTNFPRRVGHVDGPVVRKSDDVATKSSCAISFFPLPEKTFSRWLMRVPKMRYCA
ncbi:hypothetical protein B296_00022803 [Ensete ventricosum]|uniref:Uncharacterized protein n=1 Tax=Ensete ventricosum TaxID=4639 RepID=A0A426YLU1_ENSVE|nr:hypothetical protein B296_00022803 [Ensete ventricosum]